MKSSAVAVLVLLVSFVSVVHAFVPPTTHPRIGSSIVSNSRILPSIPQHHRRLQHLLATPRGGYDQKRRKELGMPDDADEYDLDVALNNNTDAGITKIVAGSFILVMIALLVVGLVIPSITDYGDGVCSPIQNGGRC
jgi:hypothetical protein